MHSSPSFLRVRVLLLAIFLLSVGGVVVVESALSKVDADAGADAGAEQQRRLCLANGFVMDALRCGTCERLSALLEEEEDEGEGSVVAECRACCSTTSAGHDEVLYDTAVIEYCNCNIARYPNVKDFMEELAPKFGERLEIKHKQGVRPRLQMFMDAAEDDSGKPVETISVGHWEKEQIAEFLDAKLAAE